MELLLVEKLDKRPELTGKYNVAAQHTHAGKEQHMSPNDPMKDSVGIDVPVTRLRPLRERKVTQARVRPHSREHQGRRSDRAVGHLPRRR